MGKTCKDCAHYEVCADYKNNICETCNWRHEEFCMSNGTCGFFKDKSLFIELPCKVGDTVYCIEFAEEIGIDKGKVYAISYTDTEWFSVRYESGLRYDHPQKAIGKSVFLTREEAEQALKERKV